MSVEALECRPAGHVEFALRVRLAEVHEGRDREADPPAFGECSGEAENPKRASAPAGFGPQWVRILAGSNALELRGIVTFWFSELKNTMSETARGLWRRKAYGSARGNGSEG
jgi:hypothetical protein